MAVDRSNRKKKLAVDSNLFRLKVLLLEFFDVPPQIGSKIQVVDGLPLVGHVSHDQGVIELNALLWKLRLV